MRLSTRDHKVLAAFVDREEASGDKLSTNGTRLDGHWIGGRGIAHWGLDGIELVDLGSRAAQSVQRALRRHAAPAQMADYKPSRKLYAGVSYGSRLRRDPGRRKMLRNEIGPYRGNDPAAVKAGLSTEVKNVEIIDTPRGFYVSFDLPEGAPIWRVGQMPRERPRRRRDPAGRGKKYKLYVRKNGREVLFETVYGDSSAQVRRRIGELRRHYSGVRAVRER